MQGFCLFACLVACLMPDCFQTQAKFTEYFPLNSMIRANVTFGKKRCFCPHPCTLNCSGDNTHLAVKPAQFQIPFLFVLEQHLEQKLLLT